MKLELYFGYYKDAQEPFLRVPRPMVGCWREIAKWKVHLLPLFVCSLLPSQPILPQEPAKKEAQFQDAALLEYWKANPRSPVDYIVDTFNKGKRWIILGEYHHVKHDVQFLLDLIPALHRRTSVRCLAFEFISAKGTKEVNRLVTQATFDRRKALDFFKRQFPDWCYEEYFKVIETVWHSNRDVGASKGPFRIVGLTPCTDWEIVHYGKAKVAKKELAAHDKGDELMAKVLKKELLTRNIPALIYTGDHHAVAKYKEYWTGTSRQIVRMGNYIYSEPYKSHMWTVSLHAPISIGGQWAYPFNGRLDRLMQQYRKAIGFDVIGTPFEVLKEKNAAPYTRFAYSFGEMIDGYIMHPTPILEYEGVTRIKDWVRNEAEYRWFWRHFPSKVGSQKLSRMSLEEYQKKADEIHDAGEVFQRRLHQSQRANPDNGLDQPPTDPHRPN